MTNVNATGNETGSERHHEINDDVPTTAKAERSLSREQRIRLSRYLIAMGIRTACVIAAIIVPGWPKALFIALAVVLPYFSAVVANAGRESDKPGDLGIDGVPLERVALAASPAHAPGLIRETISAFTHIYPRHK